jgi:hypothetical protein
MDLPNRIHRALLAFAAILLLAPISAIGQPYNPDGAVTYASNWWNTDQNTNGVVDHVNNPSESCLLFATACTPEPDTLRSFFYYSTSNPDKIQTMGVDPVTDPTRFFASQEANGDDCTNFASQVLIGGGMSFAGIGYQNNPLNENKAIYLTPEGTLTRVKDMYAVFWGNRANKIVTQVPFNYPGPIPAILAKGDVIQWDLGHTSVISSIDSEGNPRLTQHTADTFDGPITCNNCGQFSQFGTYDRFVLRL